jgi:hypothetical protein
VSGFGCSFKGTVTFTGIAPEEYRVTVATGPFCALVQTATNAYDVRGGTL